jgi:uncharacterized membrane protein
MVNRNVKGLFCLFIINCSSGYKSHISQKIRSHSHYGLRMKAESDILEFGSNNRILLSGIALTGAAETAFLTYSKLSSTPLGNLCSSPEACSNVLDGPYSTVPFLDLPLSAIAFLGYTIIAILSIAPFINKDADTSESRLIMLFTSTGMAAFSVYLMTILATVIHTSCNFCYLSAALSFTMAGIAWTQKVVPNPTNAFFVSASSVSMSFLTSAFLFYATSTLVSESAEASTASTIIVASADGNIDAKPLQEAPKITKISTPRAMLVGGRLNALNAKMYGAFWCSHCNNQKQELGSEASKLFEYVECSKDGVNSQYDTCKIEKIPGFPTWQINGQLFPGEKDLSELETLLTALEKNPAPVEN